MQVVWPLLAAACVLAACLASLPPSPHWLDCGELVAASAGLGIPHPPGHPTVVLAGAAAALLPVGSVAFRVALTSALALAAAAALLTLLGQRLLASALGLPARVAGPIAAVAAVAAAWSGPALLQGVRAEVYAANALLCIAALLALAGPPTPRRLGAAGLCVGLGLANHHYLVVLALAGGALVVLAARPRPTPGALAAGAGSAALGLAAYVLLPVRALADPLVAWGDPKTPARLVWTASARVFSRSLEGAAERNLLDNLLHALFMLMDALGPLAALAGVVGLGLLVRRRPREGILVVAAVVGVLLSKALMGFDPANPDLHGYFLTGTLLLAVGTAACAGVALAAAPSLSPRMGRALRVVVGLALVAWPACSLRSGGPGLPGPGFDDVRRVASATLDELPPHAVLLSADFNLVFALWAARATEGARPDVALVHRPYLSFPGYADAVARRHPDLAGLARGPWRGAPDPRRCLARGQRPIRAEPHPDLPIPCLGRLRADGVLARPAPPGAPPAPAPRPAWTALEAGLDLDDPQTRRWLVWSHWQHGRLRLASADAPGARYHLEAARRFARGSPELAALEAGIERLRQ